MLHLRNVEARSASLDLRNGATYLTAADELSCLRRPSTAAMSPARHRSISGVETAAFAACIIFIFSCEFIFSCDPNILRTPVSNVVPLTTHACDNPKPHSKCSKCPNGEQYLLP